LARKPTPARDLAAKYGVEGYAKGGSPAVLKAYKPSLRERAQYGAEDLYARLLGREPGYGNRQLMEKATGLLDVVPGVGDVLGVDETKRALDRKQYLEAGLLGAGTLLGAIPIVGDVAGKVVKTVGKEVLKGAAAKGTKTAVKEAEKLAAKYTPQERAILSLIDAKATRQEKSIDKLNKTAKSTDTPPPIKTANRSRLGTSATVFRDMERDAGPEAVMAAAAKGEHLTPQPSGGYLGAPRSVSSPQALGNLRAGLDKRFSDATSAVAYYDPERVGDWYQRAKGSFADTVEPYALPRALENNAAYSAGVSPQSELGFTLKHEVSRALGAPSMAYRGPVMRMLDDAVATGRSAKLGPKTGEYVSKIDPRVPVGGLFGVNDFRAAQNFGYTEPKTHAPWRAAVSAPMHRFMDAENALAVKRANEASLAGRNDWTGPHLQELPWVLGKAQDLYSRGKSARFAGDPLAGFGSAIREANKTQADFLPSHALSATYETAPGKSGKHVSEYHSMSPEDKAAYEGIGTWAQTAPEHEVDLPGTSQTGLGPRDTLYGAAKFRQLPTVQGTGAYLNSEGAWENNALNIARPLVDFPTGGGGGRISPVTQQGVSAVERLRALIDAQEAGAANLPNTGAALKGKNNLLIDTGGKLPSAEQLKGLQERLDAAGLPYGATSTNRGALLFPFDPGEGTKGIADFAKKYAVDLDNLLPGSKPKRAVASTTYVPGLGVRDGNSIRPSTPFSGEATMGALQDFADLPPELALNIGESDQVRRVIRQKTARDEISPNKRVDLQNTRRFFSEADWPKAVALIRKGMAPAAALAALGYASSSLAAEEDRGGE
jgi:hypothetical protein